MKYHGTASAFSIAPYRVSRLLCPQCQDLIIAATKSQHVSTHEVRHWWACETCGHEFRTTVRWQSSFVQSMSAADSAMVWGSQRGADNRAATAAKPKRSLSGWNLTEGLIRPPLLLVANLGAHLWANMEKSLILAGFLHLENPCREVA